MHLHQPEEPGTIHPSTGGGLALRSELVRPEEMKSWHVLRGRQILAKDILNFPSNWV